MDFRKVFKGVPDELGTNLTAKIGNPPELTVSDCICMWSDLLGFGKVFTQNNWKLNPEQQRAVYERLSAAHSSVLYYSSCYDERNLILNDGIAKVYRLRPKHATINNVLDIGIFLRSCIELHMSVNETELENGYPGCRTVLAFGESIEYLIDEIRYDDYVLNYTKPKGASLSTNAQRNGNPTVIYNPKELQMNTAFSKAYILESFGSRIGLEGNRFFVDQSLIDAVINYADAMGYKHEWVDDEEGLKLFIPRNEGDVNDVILGFCFDKSVKEVTNDRIRTKVYRLLRYYPWDERTDEFYFDLEGKS